MADLFGEDYSRSSEEEGRDGLKGPARVPVTNGHGEVAEEEEEVVTSSQSGIPSLVFSDEVSPRNGEGVEEEEEEEEELKGPRDDISVSVTQYQKTADDFTFDIDVRGMGWVGLVIQCS